MVAFWLFSWETVKGEVMVVFKDFFVSGKFVCEKSELHLHCDSFKEGRGG